MANEIEYKGNWYLSETPDRQACGTLSITEEGKAIIELIGSLRDLASESESGTPLDAVADVILGVGSGGEKITLLGRFITGADFSIAGLPHPALKRRPPRHQSSRETADYAAILNTGK